MSNRPHQNNTASAHTPLRAKLLVAALGVATGCASQTDEADTQPARDIGAEAQALHALIGPEGGDLVGEAGSAFAGVKLHIPAGALLDPTEIHVRPVAESNELPRGAVACGPMFELSPVGLTLAKPATLTLPFSATAVNENHRFADEVKVWWLGKEGWGQRAQTESEESSVSVQIAALSSGGAGINPPEDKDIVHVTFTPDPKMLPCLAQYPDDPSQRPVVLADIVRGELNDGLFLRGKNIQPGLQFDLFSMERTLLRADGSKDPDFHGFGFAWYQSDLQANDHGTMRASIRTILLDQIFGFDPDVKLGPTNTFELGFWFNDPNAAAECGFDPSKPTPFNGEHRAGPLAMTTLPDAETGLGPLCTKPDTSVSPARCDG
jgi:hypothetical protein